MKISMDSFHMREWIILLIVFDEYDDGFRIHSLDEFSETIRMVYAMSIIQVKCV